MRSVIDSFIRLNEGNRVVLGQRTTLLDCDRGFRNESLPFFETFGDFCLIDMAQMLRYTKQAMLPLVCKHIKRYSSSAAAAAIVPSAKASVL